MCVCSGNQSDSKPRASASRASSTGRIERSVGNIVIPKCMPSATAGHLVISAAVDGVPDRYVSFTREEWAALRAATPLTLGEDDLADLRGINERLALDEVADVYLPLSRLLNLHVAATQELHRAPTRSSAAARQGARTSSASAGSVAVGKSTTARVLQALLARWPDHPQVDLVTTDGFLLPNARARGARAHGPQGVPRELRRAPAGAVPRRGEGGARRGARRRCTRTSSTTSSPARSMVVRQPDIVIVEGLNVLQAGAPRRDRFVSDFFDFSIYVDADEADIEQWYVDRFLTLRDTAFTDPASYFHRFAALVRRPSAMAIGRGIWATINGPNLRENILPTRERADLVLEKGPDHSIKRVQLRRL